MPKGTLRTVTLAKRRELALELAAEKSLALQKRCLALPEFKRAKTVALYAAVQREVDTALLAETALDAGKTVLFPAVIDDDLEFRRVRSLADFAPGRFKIPEPIGESCRITEADVIVVPGVAFDCCGRRIGYGKGYYDRSLHLLEGSGRLVGFCYDFQLVEEIVGEPHDVTMDLIVTELRVVRVNKNICEGEPSEN
ncbi:5-formyltetrahydrofolate cyclo-ligase [Geomonas sp.]|uniref:5-formyltetrahydrofolate cyclo-ligase n=1 Tax=Geomonas sp. TaxID=2651584 RepID=UPI002B47E216|nr:5-formyltetrahydrofolate cyclo-ligase [Geomonas sp.]HJV36553.1 5-formyltetrahydrofolate cyclo-ligase [Geomonas sp.]